MVLIKKKPKTVDIRMLPSRSHNRMIKKISSRNEKIQSAQNHWYNESHDGKLSRE